ncbi:site-specific integrase [Thomasclavelia cocleata]|uniref:Site-specific recombinase XerD n=1 Tax=Thomasclavelia cocleata TaxID=69824 RepID=A0A1I0BDB4_9FIRM|nr:site-specific integrase [Thomasclavelia cocleata]MCR1959917.1 site-specific integrase [Thomasclavelia cocleata]NDO41739.1 site-specific integrase [Thomasclavelia cocleata]PJN79769.1 site-specific integrase [Thomasclavelia cocleata]SET04883.1 Site-specific recombinase XerD [Thomasclavelia cocleata]
MGKNLKGEELGVGYGQRKDNNKYYFRFNNRFGARETLLADSYREIQTLARKALKEDAQKKNATKNMTVKKLFEYWNDIYRVDIVKSTTRRKYRGVYNQLIKGRWANNSIKSIDTVFLKTEYSEISKIAAKGSLETWVYLVKGMFSMAYEEEFIGRNPSVSLKAPERLSKEKIPLTEDEISIFLTNAVPSIYFNVFIVALNTGLRVGEISGLKITDVDFENKTIYIHRQLHYLHDKNEIREDRYLVDSPKTKTSNRYIPINDAALKALKNQLALNKLILNKARVAKTVGNKYEELMFLNSNGTPVYERLCNDAIKKIIRNINLKRSPQNEFRKFTMHVLRVTFASKCYESGIDMKLIQKWLGHSKITTTMGIYVKLRAKDDLEKINIISTGTDLVQGG